MAKGPAYAFTAKKKKGKMALKFKRRKSAGEPAGGIQAAMADNIRNKRFGKKKSTKY